MHACAGVQVRDSASDVPAGYEPVAFKSKALQHTCPELTWDADDPDRAKALAAAAAAPAPGAAPGRRRKGKGKPTAEDLNEDNLRAYLATDSGGSSSGDDGSDADGAGVGAGDGGVEAVRARCALLCVLCCMLRSVSLYAVCMRCEACCICAECGAKSASPLPQVLLESDDSVCPGSGGVHRLSCSGPALR